MTHEDLQTARYRPSQASTCELREVTRYNQARALRLDHAARSQRVSSVLRNLELRARLEGVPHGNLEELAANRYKYYGPDHPWAWIRPYLDSAKLHVYLDCYPGLSEMKAGLYPRA